MTPRGSTIAVFSYYRITWQLLITLVSALAIAADVVRIWIGIPFFLISFFLMTPYGGALGKDERGRRRLGIGIGTALLLLSIYQITRISHFEELVGAMIELISGFLPLMLLNHRRPRSYWLAILTVSVIAIGSISFSASVVIYLGFLVFIAILLLNLNAANLYLPDAAGDVSSEEIASDYFRQFAYALPAGLVSAALIFLLFPRMQSFTMSLGKFMSKPRTGYSGGIELSGEGELGTSAALAFVVESPDRAWLKAHGEQLLFRGDALDTFDGTRWSSTLFEFKPQSQASDVRVTRRHEAEMVDLTVYMEPTPSTAIFYPGVLVNASGPRPHVASFLFNVNGSVVRDQYGLERFEYTLRIAEPVRPEVLPRAPLAQQQKALKVVEPRHASPHELTAKERDLYLEVPDAVRDAPWWEAWRAEVGVDPAVMGFAEARLAIDQYFQKGFTATLENRFSGANAFEAFLTQDRKGHCEYFATATTLLLRSLGVPARVVVGYRGGVFNDLIDALEVREESAHAWVEAYLPGHGWHSLDPTPPGATPTVSRFMATARLYINAATFWFRQYVIDYDYATQRSLIRSIRDIGKREREAPFDWKGLLGGYGRAVGIAVVVVVFLLVVTRARRRRGAEPLPLYWRRFQAKLARDGVERAKGETYAGFCARASEAGVDQAVALRVAAAIEQDLYAEAPLAEAERTAVLAAVDALPRRLGAGSAQGAT